MNQLMEKSLSDRVKYSAWVILSLYVLAHLIPYVPKYAIPHLDILNVLSVINYIHTPEFFQGDYFTQTVSYYHVMTAPVYFYGIAYPLDILLPTRWVVFAIGFLITLASTYFAGGQWKTWMDLLIATAILMILLHLHLNPLEGNRRSFTAFFLLALFWMEQKNSYLWELFFVALSAGIYPPVTLIMILYLAFKKLQKIQLGGKTFTIFCLEIAGFGLVLVAVLSPYLMNVLFFDSDTTFSSFSLSENYYTQYSFFEALIYGHEGALFFSKHPTHFNIFSIFLVIFLIEFLILGRYIFLRFRYIALLFSGLVLWGLAHLLNPMIYHPFKYTRLTFVLGLAIPVLENLPVFVRKLQSKASNNKLLLFSSLIVNALFLGLFIALNLQDEMFPFEKLLIWGDNGWELLVSLPIFLTAPILLKKFIVRYEIICLLSIILLLLLIYYPHDFFHDYESSYKMKGLSFQDFDGMYKYLSRTPPGTMVVGPPIHYMDPIAAFAKRPTYLVQTRGVPEGICERIKKFWKVYFSESLSRIDYYLNKNDIDYLLIDREIFRGPPPRRYVPGFTLEKCKPLDQNNTQKIIGTPNPALDRHFPDAAWNKDQRLYLLEKSALTE